jgi:lipoprotein-anchoring transpeptidase ErfK/SrfK
MKTLLASIAVSLAVLAGLLPVAAQQRYATPPPVVLSPNLSAPWVMQLRQERPRVERRSGIRIGLERHHIRPVSPRAEPAAGAPEWRQAAAAQRPHQPPTTVLNPIYLPQTVAYSGGHAPGTIVIDTANRFLYLVGDNGRAMRYGVGVGKEGFSWTGTETITRKAEWPGWTPPAAMIERERAKGRILPAHMPGGPANPLGARALYLGSTLYRIHGTNQPETIGRAVSSGCIRMRNEDVIDLYGRVKVGTRVVVL